MKVQVKFSVPVSIDVIDLADYGYDNETRFEDLSEDEQNEITDSLRDGMIVNASCKTIED